MYFGKLLNQGRICTARLWCVVQQRYRGTSTLSTSVATCHGIKWWRRQMACLPLSKGASSTRVVTCSNYIGCWWVEEIFDYARLVAEKIHKVVGWTRGLVRLNSWAWFSSSKRGWGGDLSEVYKLLSARIKWIYPCLFPRIEESKTKGHRFKLRGDPRGKLILRGWWIYGMGCQRKW